MESKNYSDSISETLPTVYWSNEGRWVECENSARIWEKISSSSFSYQCHRPSPAWTDYFPRLFSNCAWKGSFHVTFIWTERKKTALSSSSIKVVGFISPRWIQASHTPSFPRMRVKFRTADFSVFGTNTCHTRKSHDMKQKKLTGGKISEISCEWRIGSTSDRNPDIMTFINPQNFYPNNIRYSVKPFFVLAGRFCFGS